MIASPRTRIAQRGFTLIELLVALVVFATMAVIAYSGLSAVTRTWEVLDGRERELAAVGRAMTMIERDLRSVARRPVRDGDGRALPALMAQLDTLELSSHGRGRSLGPDLGLIERVGYVRDGNGLHRLRWTVLDRAQTSSPERRMIVEDITQLRLRFLDAEGRWHPQWPRQNDQTPEALPRAVEFALTHERLGELLRLVELPEVPLP